MRSLSGKHALRGGEGLILIEVMMAAVFLALLVTPLVNGVMSVTRAADVVRGKTADLCDSVRDCPAGDTWEWGEVVSQAWWRPGPTLHVHTSYDSGVDRVVGLWADGWLLGEWTPSEDGHVQVAASVWTDLAGDELIIRVRQGEEAWGPPWRLVVPMADGQPLASESAPDVARVGMVAHVPALANPGLGLSSTGAVVAPDLAGPPFIVSAPGAGTHEIELDDRRQSWKTEAGRDLDIYF